MGWHGVAFHREVCSLLFVERTGAKRRWRGRGLRSGIGQSQHPGLELIGVRRPLRRMALRVGPPLGAAGQGRSPFGGLQVVVQRRAHPAHAAILLSLESPFAALGGWLLLGELLSGRALIGCGLMLAGMLLSQLWPALTRARTATAPSP